MGRNSPTGPAWLWFSPLCVAHVAAQRISTAWPAPTHSDLLHLGSFPIHVTRPSTTWPAGPASPARSRTGPPRHLRRRGVAQETKLNGGVVMKDFPLDYLQQKSTDSVANQNGN
jgi:hypothetical protein